MPAINIFEVSVMRHRQPNRHARIPALCIRSYSSFFRCFLLLAKHLIPRLQRTMKSFSMTHKKLFNYNITLNLG